MRKTKQDNFFKIGQKIGNWTVVNNVPQLIQYDMNRYKRFIEVECVCGNKKLLSASVLRIGSSKSCGCSTYGRGKQNPAWKGVGFISGTYYGKIKENAKGRKLKFTVSMEYLNKLLIEQHNKCIFSGLQIKIAETKAEETTASLDRIDSSKGYTEGNVQWVHKSVNLMKQSLSDKDFVDLCEMIVNNKNGRK